MNRLKLALIAIPLAACAVPKEHGDTRGPVTRADRVEAAREAEAYCAERGKKAQLRQTSGAIMSFDCVEGK